MAALSLPLMRKTFIEADPYFGLRHPFSESLPLMRKTFIEAILPDLVERIVWNVSSAYAEDFH